MKQKINLFTKIITPIIVVGVIFSYFGFLYLNSLLETNIHHEVEQKLNSKIHYIDDHIKSEFKLLFYLYGTEQENYKKKETISQNEILNYIKKYISKNNDIVYIINSNEYIQLSKNGLLSSELANIVRTNRNHIIIDDVNYVVKQEHFKAWDWRIIYLLDTTSFEDIIYKNKLALLGIVYVLLLLLVILISIIFKMYIKNPIDLLLKHFKSISKGKYLDIDTRYNTKEIDRLIDDVNDMTKSIMYREDESKTLFALTKQNEEYMKDILSSQSSIIIINDRTEILDVNDSFLTFFNEYNSLDDFKNEHQCVCDYFIEEEGFIYKFSDINWVTYLLENHNLLHKVKILKNKTYSTFAIQAKKSEKYDRTIITMTDISELEKSTTLLEQYKKAVDAGAIVSKADLAGKITYINDKFIEISGYTKEELIGSDHNIVRSENSSSETFMDMWKTIQNKKIWHGEIENRKKDGGSYFVSATIVPILDENNNIYEYVALRYDFTEQVLDKQKAQKAESAKSNFLANMSHEIRTPLNAIMGFTKLLLSSDLSKKDQKYINIIDQSSQNLLGIINDILDLSKIESGSLTYENIEFDPFVEFDGVANLFTVKANEKDISFVSYIDPKIPRTIMGDPLRIKQVLSNLISNAIKFTPTNGTIFSRVELFNRDNNSCKLRVSIQDSGIGIAKEKQKLIFEEFSQADDSTSREFGGTGLGLSISNKIIQDLGSMIQLESEEGKGAKFFFDIDFETNVPNDSHLEEFKKLKVAIVRPDKIERLQCELLEEYLTSLSGLDIIDDCTQTDKILSYDIVFMDVSVATKELLSKAHSDIKFVLLCNDQSIEYKEDNIIMLYIPFNSSFLFDILVSCVDHESLISHSRDLDDRGRFQGSVLIAEDHEINQQLIAALLDLRGVRYTFANNGNEAVEHFNKGKYDLIFMDINMPEKNGIEASKEISDIEKQKNLEHTPIIALTANVIEIDKHKTTDIGIDGYIYKPIDEVKLDEVLTQYLLVENDNIDTNYKEIENNILPDKSFDIEEVADKMGLPQIVVEKIVRNFCDTVDGDLENLKDAVANKDFTQTESFAHKIKGAALNLRMDAVANFAKHIEELSPKEDLNQIKSNFIYMEKAIKEVQITMKK